MEQNINNNDAYFTFDKIIGNSKEIKIIIENCKLVADSPSTILIEGESGTGKEVLAQSIHNYGIRANNRFVAINCGAIPKDIIESELFGYEEGAFTGSKKGGRVGKIEFSNNGTLFLDEIGDMPLCMQVKLLRVIQEGRITRIGCNKEIKLNIRVIAATNKNLKEEVKKGTFREDLYYRLCVIPISLPPLRERKEDILNLIEYFLDVKTKKLNKEKIYLENDLIENLVNYKWPGNIREIENVIENLVNLNGKLSINFSTEKELTNSRLKNEENDVLCDISNKYKNDFNEEEFNLEFMEKETIIKSLKYTNNNFTKASKLLGISRNTLYLKLKKYKIS